MVSVIFHKDKLEQFISKASISKASISKATKNDDYTTPLSAWESLKHIIPKNKIIYSPFYNEGKALKYMTQVFQNKIIHINEDFFTSYMKHEFDIIVDNPPYSNKISILKILKQINKPFCLLLPVTCLTSQYIYKLFGNEIQYLIPKARIHFEINNEPTKRCTFSTIWVCWKFNLPLQISYL